MSAGKAAGDMIDFISVASKNKRRAEQELGEHLSNYLYKHRAELSQNTLDNYNRLRKQGYSNTDAIIAAGISAAAGRALTEIINWVGNKF